MRRLAMLAVSALAISACLGSDFSDSLEAGWELTSGTVGGQAIEPPDTHPITISFAGNVVGGTASCNGYGGEYRVSGSSISFGDLFITEMACQPQEAMNAESLFMQALGVVTTAELGDGTLTLRGTATELVFDLLPPVPEAEMLNTIWVLDGLINGDVVSSVSGERATLEFFTDGSLLGSTGCRSISGQYQVNGADIGITDLSAQGDCDPTLADQDSHVVSVLEGGVRVDINENTMTLIVSGGEGLVYRADG